MDLGYSQRDSLLGNFYRGLISSPKLSFFLIEFSEGDVNFKVLGHLSQVPPTWGSIRGHRWKVYTQTVNDIQDGWENKAKACE